MRQFIDYISGRAGERFSIRMERKNHESRSRFAFSRGSQKVEGEGRKRSHPTFIHFQGKSIIKITEKIRNSEFVKLCGEQILKDET